jgi:hypothetical protein
MSLASLSLFCPLETPMGYLKGLLLAEIGSLGRPLLSTFFAMKSKMVGSFSFILFNVNIAHEGCKMMVLLGEVGGVEEYAVCEALSSGAITKPVFISIGSMAFMRSLLVTYLRLLHGVLALAPVRSPLRFSSATPALLLMMSKKLLS